MTVFANNLRRMLGKKSSWVFLLIIPIVLNVFVVSLSTHRPQWVLAVRDRDQTALTRELADEMRRDGKVMVLDDTADTGKGFLDGEYDAVVTFDRGYTDAMLAGRHPQATVEMQGAGGRGGPLVGRVEAFLTGASEVAAASRGDRARFEKGLERLRDGGMATDYRTFSGGSVDAARRTVGTLGYLALAMLLMMASSAVLLLTDRTTGVFDRVRLTPVSSWSYHLQYLLSLFVITAVQLAVVLTALPLVTGVSYGTGLRQKATVVGLSLVFGLFCVAKAMLVYRIVPSKAMGTAINTLVDLPMLMLAGALWPRDVMPRAMQVIGDAMPPRWYLDGVERTVTSGSVGAPLALLLGLTAALLAATALVRGERHR